MSIVLRPDQAKAKAEVYDAWNNGNRNVLLVAPTGWGKSVAVSDVALDGHMRGESQAIIAHRNELVSQMSLHIAKRGIKHRIVAAKSTISEVTAAHRSEFNGRSFIDPTSNCGVISVDTLVARGNSLDQWCRQVDKWTTDECHHAIGNEHRDPNKWGRAISMFPNALGLGVTGSPTRADGLGLGRHADGPFDCMVLAPPMREIIELGALVDYEICCPPSDLVVSEDDFAPSGDLSPKKGREASKKSHIVGDVVREYVGRAYGRKFICFATDVETAVDIANQFNAVGIPVAAVSAKTPSAVRADYIQRFRVGKLLGLINVDLFSEGFDCPDASVVIMARPTGSLAVYLQQVGRALRRDFNNPNKIGLIIDHVSNVLRHGLPDKPHYWTLDRRERNAKREKDPEEIELTACRGCSRPYLRCLPACPYCGWVPPLPEGGGRSIAMVDGDLTLLDMATLAKMRAVVQLPSPAAMGAASGGGALGQIGAVNRSIERHASQQALAESIAIWAGWQRAKGRSDPETYRRFYLTLGVDVASALSLPRKDMDAITAKVTEWVG